MLQPTRGLDEHVGEECAKAFLEMSLLRESDKLRKIPKRKKMEARDESEFRESHQDCAGVSLLHLTGSSDKSGIGYHSGDPFFLGEYSDFSVGGCCACTTGTLRANVRA
jgi:hypothetical protein